MQSINIYNLEIINHTDLGRIVNAFAKSSEAIKLLGPPYLEHSFGFMDGGCLAFAKGLESHFEGSELAMVCERVAGQDPIIHHFVLKADLDGETCYIDADGAATEEQLLTKMAAIERRDGDMFVVSLKQYEQQYHAFDEDDDLIFTYEEVGLPESISREFEAFSLTWGRQCLLQGSSLKAKPTGGLR